MLVSERGAAMQIEKFGCVSTCSTVHVYGFPDLDQHSEGCGSQFESVYTPELCVSVGMPIPSVSWLMMN